MLIWFFLIISLIVFGLLMYEFWFNNNTYRIGNIPSFLPAVSPHLTQIIEHYEIDTTQYYFYEIGSGFGHILKFFESRYTWKHVYGVELDKIWFAAAALTLGRKKNITIINDNATTHDYKSPAICYAYMRSQILNEIYKNGGFKGQFLISLTFTIDGVKPKEKIKLNNPFHTIYIYDFRDAPE